MMKKGIKKAWLCLGIMFVSAQIFAQTILVSGEIAADQTQKIIAPMSANWQLRIDWMADEGTFLKQGEPAVRFDNSANDSQILQVTEKNEQAQAEGERTIARLEKEVALANSDVEIAKIRVQLAKNEAIIEARYIGELNHADNQLALSRAQQVLSKAHRDAGHFSQQLKEARIKTELDQSISKNDLNWFQALSSGNSVSAEMDGFLLYKKHPWTRSKFKAGDNVQTSFYIAEVLDTSNMYVRLFINAVDRTHLNTEDSVKIFLDAYPEKSYQGKIIDMQIQGESRKEWGNGLYMQGRVEFVPGQNLPELIPGMSALVELSL